MTVAGKPSSVLPPGTERSILRQAGMNRADHAPPQRVARAWHEAAARRTSATLTLTVSVKAGATTSETLLSVPAGGGPGSRGAHAVVSASARNNRVCRI